MDLFKFVKSQVLILDVVGQYTRFKKAGHYYKAMCPFHAEKTPSFTVSPEKNIFYCFGCHSGGDVISFIAKMEHLSQIEAVRYLIDCYNLEIPKNCIQKEGISEEQKGRYNKLCEAVSNWCYEKLINSKRAKNYLIDRGIDPSSMKFFCIGYFPPGSKAIAELTGELQKKGFLTNDLIEAKILVQGNRNYFSPFEERIIFPIYDHVGRCCGFGGRVFREADTRPKYYNSHDSLYFNKGSLLFGFDKAKKIISQKEEVILVEGYTDCISLFKHGWRNVVATLGTACTSEHLKQLTRYAKRLYILFDGDDAGKKAILRLTELCWEYDLDLFVIHLPAGKDPASFLLEEGDLHSRISQAEDIFDFFISFLGNNFREKGLQERLELTRHFIRTIGRLDDHIKRDLLSYKAASAFDIPSDVLRQEINLQGSVRAEKEKKVVKYSQEDAFLTHIPQIEKKLFSAILHTIDALPQEHEILLINYFSQPLQRVLQKALDAVGKESVSSFEEIYEIFEDDEKQWVSGLLLQWPCDDMQMLKTLEDEFAKKLWKKSVNEIAIKVKYAQQKNDNKEIAVLLQELQELKLKLLGRGLI